jgi:hypothetical protein
MNELVPPMCFVPFGPRDHIFIYINNILWIEGEYVEKGVVVEYVD